VSIFDIGSGLLLTRPAVEAYFVYDMAFSPDGQHVATTSNDNLLQVWDATSGDLIGHPYELPGAGPVAYNPDGQSLAAGEVSGSIHVLSAANGRELYRLDKHSNWLVQFAYSADGTRLATASGDKTVKVWRTTTTQEWLSLSLPAIPDLISDLVTDLAFRPASAQEGLQIAATVERINQAPFGAARGRYTTYLWDFATGEPAANWQPPYDEVGLAFNDEGTLLATAGRNDILRIRDPRTGAMIHNFTHYGSNRTHSAVVFYRDSQRVALVQCHGGVTVWDVATQKLTFQAKTPVYLPEACHGWPVVKILLSPDSRVLAVSGPDERARLYDADTGELLQTLGDQTAAVYGLAMSSDGRLLATGSDDSTIVVWDIAAEAPVFRLTGHSQGVTSLAFSPDDNLLASGSWDGLVKLWNMESGEEKLALYGQGGEVRDVAFSPDGRYLIAGGYGSSIHVYLTRLEDLVALAETRVTRTLTPEECQKYLRVEACPSR
jgi:WD40 repeat protein